MTDYYARTVPENNLNLLRKGKQVKYFVTNSKDNMHISFDTRVHSHLYYCYYDRVRAAAALLPAPAPAGFRFVFVFLSTFRQQLIGITNPCDRLG